MNQFRSLATVWLMIVAGAWAGPLMRLDFETPDQIDAVRAKAGTGCEIAAMTNTAATGRQSLAVKPTLLGSCSACLPWPTNGAVRVVSFSLYDPLFEETRIGAGFDFGWELYGAQRLNGSNRWFSIGLNSGRERPHWYVAEAGQYTDTSVLRHSGWTRFDAVILTDATNGPRELVVWIDGREAVRRPAPGLRPGDLVVRAAWGAGTILVDDLRYDDDPASFRPAVVQGLRLADEAGTVLLRAGEPLRVPLALDRAGARAAKGLLTVGLRDAREQTVDAVRQELDWSATTGATLTVSFRPPPSSRHYWVVARYTETDHPEVSDHFAARIEVQYRRDGAPAVRRDRLALARPWDWLPVDPDQRARPPADWSASEKVSKLWYTRRENKREDCMAAWYRRVATIPAGWKGKRVLLAIEQPQALARVFWNGQLAGEIGWPGGELDLTDRAAPGTTAELAILVEARAEVAFARAARQLLGPGVKLPEDYLLADARGLGGEVLLRSEPTRGRIAGVTLDPRVTNMTLHVVFACEGLAGPGPYTIRAIVSRGGREVKAFTTKPFAAADGGAEVRHALPWPDAELWDLGQPSLYDFDAELAGPDGRVLDAIWPERFGFREIGFDGRLVKLNGRPVNLFMPHPVQVMGNKELAAWLDRFNLNYLSNEHIYYYFAPGWSSCVQADDHFDFCDEAGCGADLGVSAVWPRKALLNQVAAAGGDLVTNVIYWSAFERVVRHAVRRYGNRPGLFFYNGCGAGGQLELGGMYNPLKMDGVWLKAFKDRPVMQQYLRAEGRALDIVHACDPRRRVIAQDSGSFDDSIHITHYAGFMAIQEMIEANTCWLQNGTKPYMISEQAAPFTPNNWCDLTRKRGYGTMDPIGYVAEWAAITKGDRAFHRQPVDQEELDQFEERCRILFEKRLPQRKTTMPPLGPLYAYSRNPDAPSVLHEVNDDRAREQWLHWRADGIGLLNCWAPAGKSESMSKWWAPVTGFLAGPAERRTDKTHLLRPGEVWTRAILVLNNGRMAATVQYAWDATLGTRPLAKDTGTIKVPAGGQAFVPVRVAMPAEAADAEGALAMTLRIDGRPIAEDRVDFDVVAPAQAPALRRRVAVIDPEGATAEALRRLGVPFRQLNLNAGLADYGIVVFGRRAFRYEAQTMSQPIDLAALMAAGKRVLVLEQDEDTLRSRFMFRTEYVSPRQAFGRIAGHPALAGLSDRRLQYWRGEATLTDGYAIARTQPMESERDDGGRWSYVWNDGKEHPRPIKWGNHHNVATVVILKPDRGNFRTLVDCEFGLNHAAVWELEQGPGRMVFSQMDLTGRTDPDPAAERLLANLLGYMDRAEPAAWSGGAAYLGGPQGADLLARLKAVHRTIRTPAEARHGETLILGELAPAALAACKQPVTEFVAAGGVCLSLPRAPGEWGWLPFEVGVTQRLVDATAVDKPSHPLLAGLSNGELYYKGRVPVTAVTSTPPGSFMLQPGILAVVPHGRGRYVFCQVAPASFDVARRFYLLDSQRLTYRAMQILFANLGIPMEPPGFIQAAAGETGPAAPPLDLAAAAWQGLKAGEGEEGRPAGDDPRWKPVKVPGYANDQRPEWQAQTRVLFWYRCRFTAANVPAAPATLFIGAMDDEDDVWVNGRLVGHTGRDTNANDWLLAPRYYPISAGVLAPGENEVLVRLVNLEGKSGITVGPARIQYGGSDARPRDLVLQLAACPSLDLSGRWMGIAVGTGEQDLPPENDPRWHPLRVPGTFEEQHPDWSRYDGAFWCRLLLNVRSIPDGARPVLHFGAVDDEDDTYLNGQKIGHTGAGTNPADSWMAPRYYPIPAGVLKTGSNLLTVRVNDLRGTGGIATGPAEILWVHPAEAAKARLAAVPYLFEVGRVDDPYFYHGW